MRLAKRFKPPILLYVSYSNRAQNSKYQELVEMWSLL
ncbi:hypothetical protein THIOKS11400014 [Thiocapsa sp. KS1]|nr:hypothetical protein THIOKS11400014 [Thiocapsa sp. KS1]